jgi:hypothetical protein
MNRSLAAVLLLAACGQETTLQCDSSPSTPTEPTEPTEPTVATVPVFRDLSFFQVVEVPAGVGDDEILPADRNAPLIAGREALLRANVTLPEDYAPGLLEVVVEVVTPSGTVVFRSPVDSDLLSLVTLPATAMAAGATYSVHLTEDDAERDLFPDDGAAELGAKVTGGLKVRVVPFEVNGFVPDTSQVVIDGYEAALMAVYPVTQVEIDVAPVEVWGGAFDLGDINVRVGQLQEEAMFGGQVDWDVYYYAMVNGVATRDEFTGSTGTSESGGSEPLTRAYFAAGAAFGDQKSEDTLIHEIGHTHGLLHTACSGTEDNPDPDFPYADGTIGIEGYDFRTGTFVPPDAKDMMGYCYPRWVSDYHYAKLADHVAYAQTYNSLH